MAAAEREFDLVVWGATGFTGRLVAEYLARQYPPGTALAWAAAGRDPARVGQVLAALGIAPGSIPVVTADSTDRASLDAMVRRTRVVLSTVGPYARYGEPLVASCAAAGTDYCDLAGEVQWMRRMIDRYQDAARASGARLVPSCGFDSIPSDLGVQFLQQAAQTRHAAVCRSIRLLVKAMRGGASGGTIASLLNAIEEGRTDPAVRRILADPYGLNPGGERRGPDGHDQRGVGYDEDLRVWTAPFVMSAINTRVVRRSNALLGYPYGRDFRYAECVIAGKGALGCARAAALAAGTGGFMLAASFELGRNQLLRRLLPAPGEGPERRARENGYFNLVLLGRLANGAVLKARVTGDRDPGYGATSRMLAESAICLARDEIAAEGGFWTPASILGDALRRRLTRRAGLEFRVEDGP